MTVVFSTSIPANCQISHAWATITTWSLWSGSPLLTISGHDHETPVRRGCWWDKVGRSVCLNVGQKLDGPPHYCVLEFTFPKSTPSLPSRIRVSAYPWDQCLEIGSDGSAQ